MWYEKRMAPEGVKTWNPSFDVTDHDLITAIVTEWGIAMRPTPGILKEIFRYKKEGGEMNISYRSRSKGSFIEVGKLLHESGLNRGNTVLSAVW